MIYYDQGRLLVSTVPPGPETKTLTREFFVINCDDGDISKTDLFYTVDGRDLPVYPIAEIVEENSYFVIANEKMQQYEPQREDGTSYYISSYEPVSYTHLRAHETRHDLVCRLLLEKKKHKKTKLIRKKKKEKKNR